MLVLTRKINESIMIGDKIEIRIMGVKGDQIKLGVSAPRDIAVYRAELYHAIEEENRKASQMKPEFLKGLRRGENG